MKDSDRPNILVIVSDQHNKHFLGCYGNEIVRTPNLDRLASEGARFTKAYCPAPVCVPSRMSFLTSRYPHRNRVWNNVQILSSGIPTWAHVLGAAGYETALIGRMHFRGPDQRHGFENRPIGEFCANYPGSRETGAPRYQYFPNKTAMANRISLDIAGTGTTSGQWMDEQVTRTTCGYLQTYAHIAKSRPLAAVTGFWLPHPPFIAPKELFEYYYGRVDIPTIEKRQPKSIIAARKRAGIADGELSEERVRVCRAAYYALCEAMDTNIGRILECLDETGLSEDTMVVYCSDHGETAGEHGLFWKCNYYEASAGIPLIARYPEAITAGSTMADIVNLVDLGPTFRDISGSDLEWDNDGHSLWSLLQSGKTGTLQETYSELGGRAETASRMARSGKWKFWVSFEHGEEKDCALFDLESDPDEVHDLSEDPGYARIGGELRKKLLNDWDPRRVCKETRIASENQKILSAWGKAIQPESPDALAFPSSEIEADFAQSGNT